MNELKYVFGNKLMDMLEQISYLQIGIYIGLLLYMLLSFLFKNHKKQLRLISIFLFLIPISHTIFFQYVS